MIVILGKTASGKDSVVKKLVSSHGFTKAVTYTTRPIRDGEVDGIDYHFINKQDFGKKVDEGFFAEWKSYDSVSDVWFYGSPKACFTDTTTKSVIILSPYGLYDVLESVSADFTSFYLISSEQDRRDRLLLRGDDPKEADRRIYADRFDFRHIDSLADEVIQSSKEDSIDSITSLIVKLYDDKYKGGQTKVH